MNNKEDLKSILLDPNNRETISLSDPNGRNINFEQVFVTEFLNQIYVILKPLDKMEGIGDKDCIVFKLIENNGDYNLVSEDDQEFAEVIYDRYIESLEKSKK